MNAYVLVDAEETVTDATEVLLNIEQRHLPFGTIHLGQGALDVRVSEETSGLSVTERVVSIEDGIRTESTARWSCPRGILVAGLRDLLEQLGYVQMNRLAQPAAGGWAAAL